MIAGFYTAAAAMIVVALALILVPMIRRVDGEARPRRILGLALGIAIVLPLATVGLYLKIGTPVALNGVPRDAPMNIDQAVAQLKAHLAEKPDDAQGWQLLAQTYSAMHQPAAARDAYGKWLELEPNDPGAMVGWAESDSMDRKDHLIDGRSLALVERAVQLEPDNQRGLWLLGISQFQHDKYADAAATWRRLQPLLDPGSNVARTVTEQIAVAESRAGTAPTPQATQISADASATTTTSPSLSIEINVAPALKSKLATGDVLFVYALAEQGPPMPLAVAKLPADTWPARVTLTDSMAMTPSMNLSSAKRVFVGARISKSGQPAAQAGDLEGDAGLVDTNQHAPVAITIDKVH